MSAYAAAHEDVAWFDGSAREVLRVTGPEAGSFLHGMVTNDVTGLAVGASCYAAMLTPKGRMVSDARVLRRAHDFLVDVAAQRGSVVKAFLEKYLISEDAEVHHASELVVGSFMGPRASAVAPAGDRLVPLLGEVDVLVERAQLASVGSAIPLLSAHDWEVIRVERGVPAFGVDMTEVTLPMEARLEHAIHHKKGRYVGHEVVVRATFRGRVQKNLMTLLLGDAAPPRGAELRVGERKAGWLTSVVYSPRAQQHVALGYVHRDFQAPGTEFELNDGYGARMTAR